VQHVGFDLISIVKSTRCTSVSNLFIYLFYNDTVHVSHGLCVHHREFKSVHTAVFV